MMSPLKLKVQYTQYVRRFRWKIQRNESFCEDAWVMLRTVQSNEAPVAYRVKAAHAPFDPSSVLDYVVRSFEGRLWWPAVWDGRLINRSEFERSAAGASTHAVATIDPTGGYESPSYHEIEEPSLVIKERGDSTRDFRVASAQRGALDVLECDGRIFVEAGDPVFYAVIVDGGIDLVIGPSAWRRLTGLQVLPGPDRTDAKSSALAGRVFGIEDVESNIRSLCDLGNGVRRRDEVDVVLPLERSDAAVRLRADAVVEEIYRSALHGLSVQKRAELLPSMFRADGLRLEAGAIDTFAVLVDAAAILEPGDARWFSEEIPGAKELLAVHPNALLDLSPEDDEALAKLSI